MVRESAAARKPARLDYTQAASLPLVGLTAWQTLIELARLRAGQKVLIHAGSGGVGTFAIQLAKHLGAQVTTTAGARNHALVKSLGADDVVDYTKEDFSRAGRVYDMVVDTVGKAGYSRSLKCLKRGALLVGVGLSGGLSSIPGDVLRQTWISITGAAKVVGGLTRPASGDLFFLKGLIEAGELRTVIDRRYSPQEIAEAYRYAEAGHKKGHVIINIAPNATGAGSDRQVSKAL